MKGIQITKPCSENWNEMTPNQKGTFCQKCSKSVYDFTKMNNERINTILLKLKGQEVCGRILTTQESALNDEFNYWNLNQKARLNKAMLFSLIVVFGLSILSCTTEQEKEVVKKFQEKAIVVLEKDAVSEDSLKIKEEDSYEVIPSVFIKNEISELVEDITGYGCIRKPLLDGNKPRLSREDLQDLPVVKFDGIQIMGMMAIRTTYTEFIEDTTPQPITEYDELGRILPTEFSALPFPNPTLSTSTIKLEVAEKTSFQIMLFNMHGGFLSELTNQEYERGTFEIPVDLTDKKPGTYLIVITSENYNETVRLIKQ